MVNAQTQIKFFDYQSFIEKFAHPNAKASESLQLINAALNDKDILIDLHRALIKWASHFHCVEVVFFNGSNAFSSDLIALSKQALNKVSFQDFQHAVLNDLPGLHSDFFEDKKYAQEFADLKCVIDLNFPAFLMSFFGKAVLFLSVNFLTKNGLVESSVNILRKTQERLADQVKRLDQILQTEMTLFTVKTELSIDLKQHFFSYRNWAKISSDVLLDLMKIVGQFYEGLHSVAIFKEWTVDCKFLKNPTEDLLVCFQSKDISFLGTLLQFFFCAFSSLLSNCVNICFDSQEFSRKILQNINLKVVFQNRSLSLLSCNDSPESRAQMLVFSSAIKSAISHDAAVILSAGGFYLGSWCESEKNRKVLGFSRFLESVFKAVTNRKEVNFVIAEDEKAFQENQFITVSSEGICIQGVCLLVSLNTYLAIFLESVASKMVLILDILNDGLLLKNKKLSMELLKQILREQIFPIAMNDKYCDLKNFSAMKLTDLLSGSLVFRGLFSRSKGALIQDCMMHKYADFYRQLLLLRMKEIEDYLQDQGLEGFSKKTLEQLLDKIKCFYKETKDLHAEAMIFAFWKMGAQLLNQVQIKLIGEKK